MQRETEIELEAAAALKAEYDACCKLLFSNRELLAPLLNMTVPEYLDCTREEVMACIDTASIQSSPVDDVSIRAAQGATEMSSVSDKLIRYDVRLLARNPKLATQELQIYLHIDLEVQNKYRQPYPLVKRAVYYAARLLSAQLGVLTETTDYAALQKVYSIWICNEEVPRELQNTVTSYTLTRQDVIGVCREPVSDYDLMTVIMIRRGSDEGTERIFDYLNGIFSSDLGIIARYADVNSNDTLKREVVAMSGMGASIYEKGMAQGMERGMAQGMERGIAQGLLDGALKTCMKLVREGYLPAAAAAKELSMTEEEFRRRLAADTQ